VKDFLLRFLLIALAFVALGLTFLVIELMFEFYINPHKSEGVIQLKEYIRDHPEFSFTKYLGQMIWEKRTGIAASILVPAFIISIVVAGEKSWIVDADGRTVLRIRGGVKWLATIVTVVVCFLFAKELRSGFSLFSQVGALSVLMVSAFCFCVYWFHIVRVQFDDSVLLYRNWIGKTHVYLMADLEHYKHGWENYVLFFVGPRKLRISEYFASVELLTATLDKTLERNKNA